jgi:large subunit ribosomal protein L14
MIGMRTMLEVADNSGARKLRCILPRGGDKGLRAGLGDVVTASVKEAAPDSTANRSARGCSGRWPGSCATRDL